MNNSRYYTLLQLFNSAAFSELLQKYLLYLKNLHHNSKYLPSKWNLLLLSHHIVIRLAW